MGERRPRERSERGLGRAKLCRRPQGAASEATREAREAAERSEAARTDRAGNGVTREQGGGTSHLGLSEGGTE